MSTRPAERRRRLDPATAAIRGAVRETLTGLGAREPRVVVAVSGGADSLALASALAFLAAREAEPIRPLVSAAVVDHGLQAGSAEVAARVAARLGGLGGLGLGVTVLTVPDVPDTGQGLEARAREGRYAALESHADEVGAEAILLGHTRDDQAETVLLGLARGSGARSLAGMPATRGLLRRPLLGLTREQTRASCAAQGLEVWDDPMNEDRAFARVRARLEALPALEGALGPGIAAALARSATQLAADADALDAWAARVDGDLGGGPHAGAAGEAFLPAALTELPAAVSTRIIRRRIAAAAGEDPTYDHVSAVDALLRGRSASRVSLPGGLAAEPHPGGVAVRASRPAGGPGGQP